MTDGRTDLDGRTWTWTDGHGRTTDGHGRTTDGPKRYTDTWIIAIAMSMRRRRFLICMALSIGCYCYCEDDPGGIYRELESFY